MAHSGYSSSKKEKNWLREMRSGQKAFERRKLLDAIRAFSKATRLQPGRMEAWTNLGSALLEAGRLGESQKALERAIALSPSIMTPQMLLGDVFRLTGRVDKSLAAYERAVELERSPPSLNKLACALRSRRKLEEAKALYLEALRIAPNFFLAQVNLATLLLDCREFSRAESQLLRLRAAQLPPAERAEVAGALLSVGEYRRLNTAIETMNLENDLAPLERLLRSLPADIAIIDEEALASSRAYINWARQSAAPSSLPSVTLPGEWPLIEGLFMIPLIETTDDLVQLELKIEHSEAATGELLESLNVRDAVIAARLAGGLLADPVKGETQLRYWHSLCARGLDDFTPGHFKYTQNWSAKSPTLKRVQPALSSATLQCFLREIRTAVPEGLVQAAICFQAICDLHCFDDGNGRVAMVWANRLLEQNGEMPLLFTRELGMQGQLGEAKSLARENGGDLGPVIEVMQRAQQFAADFCRDLQSH